MVSLALMEMASWLVFFLGLAQLITDKSARLTLHEAFTFFPLKVALAFFISASMSAMIFMQAGAPLLHTIWINRGLFLIFAFTLFWRQTIWQVGKKFSFFAVVLLLTVCLYGLFQFLTGIDLVRGARTSIEPIGSFYRPVGYFSNALTYVYSMGTWFFLLLPLFPLKNMAPSQRFLQNLGTTTLFLLFLNIVASGSRGAWVSFALVYGVYFFSKIKPSFVGLVKQGSTALTLVGVLFLNTTFRNRFFSIFDLTNISNSDRLTIWRANYEIFKNNWIVGVGINTNNSMVQAEYLKLGLPRPQLMIEHHAHSDLIHIFTGTGIIGGSLYLLMLVSFLYFTYALYIHFNDKNGFLCRISLGLFLAQLFFHLGGLFQCNYTDREVNHLLMFIWFAVTSLYLYSKEPTAVESKS